MAQGLQIIPCKETIEHLPIAYIASSQTNSIGEPGMLYLGDKWIKTYYYADTESIKIDNLDHPDNSIITSPLAASIIIILNWLKTDMHNYNAEEKECLLTALFLELKRIDNNAYQMFSH